MERMKVGGRTPYEQETVINFNEEEKEVSVFTFNKEIRNILLRLAKEFPDQCYLYADYQYGSGCYKIPKDWFINSFSKMIPKRKRVMTPEQAKAASERMKNLWGTKTENAGVDQ